MSDDLEPGLSDQYRKASPWPLFVALGFVLSEVGVVLGLFPVTVGGLVLFGGTVAGILAESGYVGTIWKSLVAFGIVISVVGAAIVLVQLGPDGLAAAALLDSARPVVYRAAAIATAGLVLTGAGFALHLGDPGTA